VLYTARPNGTGVKRLSKPGIDGKVEDYRAKFSPDGSAAQPPHRSQRDLPHGHRRQPRSHPARAYPERSMTAASAVGPSSQGVVKTKWSFAETAARPQSRAASTASIRR
jgi:hypothetical protein